MRTDRSSHDAGRVALIAGHTAADYSPLLVTLEDGKPTTRVSQVSKNAEIRSQDAISIEDSGVAWFAGNNELISFDGVNTVRYELGARGAGDWSTVVVAPDGSIWSQGTGEIVHITSGVVVSYGELDGVPPTPPGKDSFTWKLVPATGGQLWASRGDEIAHYDGDTWNIHERPVPPGLGFPNGRKEIIQASDGSTYVLDGENDTLHRLQDGQWSVVALPSPGSTDNSPLATVMVLAPDGSLWFAYQDGVARFVPNP